MKLFLTFLIFLLSKLIFAQEDTLRKISFSVYSDLYYSFDFANPANHEKPNFIYNHKRHNELNANLILAKFNYSDSQNRANIALMAGNYAQYNLSAEPNWAQFIYEANWGIKLSNKKNIWLDLGIMPSHIGFESAINTDCWTLTRSILAENSPYYETGVKLTFKNKTEKLSTAFLVLNGWQRIKKPDFIQKPSIGFQIHYKPSETLTLNYSNFIGTDKPDSLNARRFYHNFFLQSEPKKKLGFIVGLDVGSEGQNAKKLNFWYSPVLIFRYILNERLKLGFRAEYYYDQNETIIATKTLSGFSVKGFSTNFDFKINNMATFRLEGKIYHSNDPIFDHNAQNNFSLTSNLSFSF